MLVSFPAFAQRVTVLGSTRNKAATSPGVIRCSVSGIELMREMGALMVPALLAAIPNCRDPVGVMSAIPPFFVFTLVLAVTVSLFRGYATSIASLGVIGLDSWLLYSDGMDTDQDPWAQFSDHEEVILTQDRETGLRAVVAIHSTKLGPALGGTRMSLYADHPNPQVAAYSDALRLSRAMSLKNALAGLAHGGGKAVILADPHQKSRQELLNYGTLIESLGGKYVTAGDVGMQVADMDVLGETSQFVTGRSPEKGGVGDSGILTALGIWQGIQACVEYLSGSNDLSRVTVGVIGAGKVGGRLIEHLIESGGAKVIAMDPVASVRTDLSATYPDLVFVDSFAEMLNFGPTIISPNAMGGFITPELVPQLASVGVSLVCGGANNQLATPDVGDLLAAAGILYAPDFMVNCGGVIQVAEELVGANVERAREQVMRVYPTTLTVLESAAQAGITPVAAAEAEAWAIINA